MLDTCYLIDHQREVLKRVPGPAHAFAARHAVDVFAVSSVVWGEFCAGFPAKDDEVLLRTRRHLRIIPVTESAAEVYGRIFREMKRDGLFIGGNDLWIASVAVSEGLPLVSRNATEFGRIAELELLTY